MKLIYEQDPRAKQKFGKFEVCNRCSRPKGECFCGKVPSLETRLKVVILQHPQEQYKVLNSARLAHLLLKNSRIFVGLSWPNFKKIAGPEEMPSEWGVLYLKPEEGAKGSTPDPLTVINRKKSLVGNTGFLRGIIAIDGSWKQAKALWWRNPWLLKLNRVSLNPGHPSLRPQVKGEGLSTIEAIAFALEHLGEKKEVGNEMIRCYRDLIIQPAGSLPDQAVSEPAKGAL